MGDAIICGYSLSDANFRRLLEGTPAMQAIFAHCGNASVIAYDRWRDSLPRSKRKNAPEVRCMFMHTPHRALYSSSGSQAKTIPAIPTTMTYHHITSSPRGIRPTKTSGSSRVSALTPAVFLKRPSATRPSCVYGSNSSRRSVKGQRLRKQNSSLTGRWMRTPPYMVIDKLNCGILFVVYMHLYVL